MFAKYTPIQKVEMTFVSLLAGAKAIAQTGTTLEPVMHFEVLCRAAERVQRVPDQEGTPRSTGPRRRADGRRQRRSARSPVGSTAAPFKSAMLEDGLKCRTGSNNS